MNKAIKWFLLLAGLALTSMITAKTLSAALSFKRGAIHNWGDLSKLNSDIDKAAYYGVDSFSPGIIPSYIAGVKNGEPDYIGDGIIYARKKGIKTYLFMSIGLYTNSDWDAFKDSASAQEHFLSDMEWVLQKYPTLDGIEMEEAHYHKGIPPDGGAEWRAFTNSFFTKCKKIVSKYKPTDQPDRFVWSFNSASDSASNVWGIGLDVKYINDNKLFNAFEIQNLRTSLVEYQDNIKTWKERLPNLEVFSCTYLNWSSLVKACKDQYPDWDSPTCWNQAFFDQIKWANSVGHSVRIFVHARLARPASMWPNDTTPGDTAGEKVKYIWSSSNNGSTSPAVITNSPTGGKKVKKVKKEIEK
ncbi:MAG: hypothetical protein PHE88_01620 [Elusimicrobia bacterium]|nr:hypothetical protein [Elusimicrobiota bacterium]